MAHLQHKSMDGIGAVCWWFDNGTRILRLPAEYTVSGKTEWLVEIALNGHGFSGTEAVSYHSCDSWLSARRAVAMGESLRQSDIADYRQRFPDYDHLAPIN